MPSSEPAFGQGEIVKVPFPYVDRDHRAHRPALIISRDPFGEPHRLVWVAMITSAANPAWADDEPVSDLAAAGLPIASVVRPMKIATILANEARTIGRLDQATLNRCLESLRRRLGD